MDNSSARVLNSGTVMTRLIAITADADRFFIALNNGRCHTVQTNPYRIWRKRQPSCDRLDPDQA